MIGLFLKVLIEDSTHEVISEHTSPVDLEFRKLLIDPGTQDTPVQRSVRRAKSHLWLSVDFVRDERSDSLAEEDLARLPVRQKAPVDFEQMIDHLIVQKRHSGFQ